MPWSLRMEVQPLPLPLPYPKPNMALTKFYPDLNMTLCEPCLNPKAPYLSPILTLD